MTTCCMPTIVATRRPWWQRLADLLNSTRLHFVAAVPTSATTGLVPTPPEQLRDRDLLPLAGLSDAMQDDIGLPPSLRARVQSLREREALWLRF